jgi:hypothetical protein
MAVGKAMTLHRLWLVTAVLLLSGCANGQGRPDLPYDSWGIAVGAPSYMEMWIESVDVIDKRGLVFERVYAGVGSISSPPNNKGNPIGWPKSPGGSTKPISGVDLPEIIFVRWQSLVEPQTYNVRINIPLWVREEMVKPREVPDCSRKIPRPMKIEYLDAITIGLAPGGIAKVWLNGGCLEPIEIGRFVGAISKLGPDMGKNNGRYAYPLTPESKAYIEKFGIPYGSW